MTNISCNIFYKWCVDIWITLLYPIFIHYVHNYWHQSILNPKTPWCSHINFKPSSGCPLTHSNANISDIPLFPTVTYLLYITTYSARVQSIENYNTGILGWIKFNIRISRNPTSLFWKIFMYFLVVNLNQ